MLIYQTKPTDPREPKQAILLDMYRWAHVQEFDTKIKWREDFLEFGTALGSIGFYEMDETGVVMLDKKGLSIPNAEWFKHGEIHNDIDRLIEELSLEGVL